MIYKTIMDLHHFIMNVQLHNASMEIHSFFSSKQIWAIMDIIHVYSYTHNAVMDAHTWLTDIHIWVHIWVMDPCLNYD